MELSKALHVDRSRRVGAVDAGGLVGVFHIHHALTEPNTSTDAGVSSPLASGGQNPALGPDDI